MGFQTGFLEEDVLPPSRSPSNINSVLPGHVNPGCSLTIEQINSKVDTISEKLDMVLENERLIIDCLQNNDFIHNTSTSRTPMPTSHNIKELTTAELEALNITKKKGTTNVYFAVMLLKKYTTDEESINCTVHGGYKSKALNKETLAKVKKGYEAIYSGESWSDAINAMNNHLRKYCSIKDLKLHQLEGSHWHCAMHVSAF